MCSRTWNVWVGNSVLCLLVPWECCVHSGGGRVLAGHLQSQPLNCCELCHNLKIDKNSLKTSVCFPQYRICELSLSSFVFIHKLWSWQLRPRIRRCVHPVELALLIVGRRGRMGNVLPGWLLFRRERDDHSWTLVLFCYFFKLSHVPQSYFKVFVFYKNCFKSVLDEISCRYF